MADLANRMQVEASFARRVSSLGSRHRRELKALLGNPPDATRVPPAFWDRVQRETEEELAALLLLIFLASATQHGLSRQQADGHAVTFARGRAAEVAASYAATTRDRLGTLVDDVAPPGSPTPPPLRPADYEGRLLKLWGPNRAAQLAASETTVAATAGGEVAIVQTVGTDEDDIWWTEADARVCPICRPLHRTKRSTWERMQPGGPPSHPGCRCWIVYANELEPVEELTA